MGVDRTSNNTERLMRKEHHGPRSGALSAVSSLNTTTEEDEENVEVEQ
jgi:hypothetical protein